MRFTSLVAIIGIAAGVAGLIFAQALALGFQSEMRDKILANTAHISIYRKDGSEIEDWGKLIADLQSRQNIRSVSPATFESALISGERSTEHAILKVEDQEGDCGCANEIEVSVGAELAEKAGLRQGGGVEIYTIDEDGQPSSHQAIVKSLIRTGLFEYDAAWVSVSPSNFKKLHGVEEYTPTSLRVDVNDIYAADTTATEIREILGDEFRIMDWKEANQPLFAALGLERKVGLAMISLIVLIAILNITTTLALLVNERKLDIAVLRTCGEQSAGIVLVFMIEGLFLGTIGILIGAAAGIAGCGIANYFGLISIAKEVYVLDHIPLVIDPLNVVITVLTAFGLCVAATIYPALKASRIKPLENLRNQ